MGAIKLNKLYYYFIIAILKIKGAILVYPYQRLLNNQKDNGGQIQIDDFAKYYGDYWKGAALKRLARKLRKKVK